MSEDLLFPAPAVPTLPVRGTTKRLPLGRIFCVGRNYEAHAREMGATVDRQAPFYFLKGAHALVVAPEVADGTIPYPPETADYHHEVEQVVAIGAPAFRVSAEQALGVVFGYGCGLDMTRRDLQAAAKEKQRPWDLGKNVEGSAVVSEIVPAAEIGHPQAGRIELAVNGARRQGDDLTSMVWSVPELIAHLSRFYHLLPGDLLFTGTPEGVGPVQPGDRLEGRLEGVSAFTVTVGPRP